MMVSHYAWSASSLYGGEEKMAQGVGSVESDRLIGQGSDIMDCLEEC